MHKCTIDKHDKNDNNIKIFFLLQDTRSHYTVIAIRYKSYDAIGYCIE